MPDPDEFSSDVNVIGYRVSAHSRRIDRLEESVRDLNVLEERLSNLQRSLERTATKDDLNQLTKRVAALIRIWWAVLAVLAPATLAFMFWLIQQQLQ